MELNLDDLLADQLVRQLMDRDGVDEMTIRQLVAGIPVQEASATATDKTRSKRRRNPEKLLDGISYALLRAIAYRDPYSTSHMEMVAKLSVLVASKLGLGAQETDTIYLGALLHDIGKIGIPLEVLIKPSRLSKEEMSLVRGHSRIGWEIVCQLRGVSSAIKEIVLLHHERLDGSGYPFGCPAKAIPFAARLVGIADVVESMTSHRPYRPALGLEPALDEIMRFRGSRYDTDIVDAVVDAADEIRALLTRATGQPQ